MEWNELSGDRACWQTLANSLKNVHALLSWSAEQLWAPINSFNPMELVEKRCPHRSPTPEKEKTVTSTARHDKKVHRLCTSKASRFL
jgi:hypothetical protein